LTFDVLQPFDRAEGISNPINMGAYEIWKQPPKRLKGIPSGYVKIAIENGHL
jgi:hypothetical protein